ncbi:hypothetical protein J4448_01050 [Candidatus Woesearchaeota archaeon]|nr:hypothetical protein [Candidatus Woesearchaeota archaeon]
MMIKQKFIKICPKCGSIDLPIRTSLVEMLMPTPEKCRKCNYTGLFPEIEINEIGEFRKEIKKV